MHSRSLLVHFPLALSLALGVAAQKAQCLPGWEWNRNSLYQDPCAIGMELDASCRGTDNFTYVRLEKGEYYVPPNKSFSGDMFCDCNTVMYSLTMACTTCQEGIVYAFPRWITACEEIYIMQLPFVIPQGTAIPRWAFHNVTLLTDQKYDDNVAKTIGRGPEEMPKPQTTAVTPRPTGAVGDGGSPGGSNTAAIVGGVVGGVVALIIILIVVFFVFRRIRKNRDKKQQSQHQETPINLWKTSLPSSPTYQPSFSTGPTVQSSAYSQTYNPRDARTFPPPMSDQSSVTFLTPLESNYYGVRR